MTDKDLKLDRARTRIFPLGTTTGADYADALVLLSLPNQKLFYTVWRKQ